MNLTIQHIVQNQQEEKHVGVMKQIFMCVDELFLSDNYLEVDKFIEEFCQQDICFQYYVCMLTAALWGDGYLKNINMLRQKAIEQGEKELPEKEVGLILTGLL